MRVGCVCVLRERESVCVNVCVFQVKRKQRGQGTCVDHTERERDGCRSYTERERGSRSLLTINE
jgi:hypothetical protein